MQFIKTEGLRTGMRLARPIYSKKGVLLFERNSLLTDQAIDSVKNFGLLGIYILEPAEPLPPISEEDVEFERFQVMMVSSIKEELDRICATKRQSRMQNLAGLIIKNYGHLETKINFYQNLRSKEDFVYRHSLNVAILCAMITHVLNVRLEEQMQTVCAAMVHGILGGDLIEEAFAADGVSIKRICMQAEHVRTESDKDGGMARKMVLGARILLVADRYDEMTAMSLLGESESEVKAIREFLEHPQLYDPEVVKALIQSINILFPGVSVELNTGEKALVLTENQSDILKPVVLSFRDNSILDLSLRENQGIFIEDVMKTMDNRYIMDTNTLKNVGV